MAKLICIIAKIQNRQKNSKAHLKSSLNIAGVLEWLSFL
jgi:hypothetical protein